MRCDKCGMMLEKGMKFCFECGTAVDEVEKVKDAEAALMAFFESQKKAETDNKKKSNCFWGTKFEIMMFAFICFGILAMTVGFAGGKPVSGIIAMLMTVCSLVAYLVGAGVIETKSRSVRFSVAFVAFLFVIPYFVVYNSDVMENEIPNMVVAGTGTESKVVQDSPKQDGAEGISAESSIEQNYAGNDDSVAESENEENPDEEEKTVDGGGEVVYTTPTGKKYHIDEKCAGKNAKATNLDEASASFEPCKKCAN